MSIKAFAITLTKCSSNVAAGRLGRTGRAGKMGKGVLVLSPFEAPFLDELRQAGVQCPPDEALGDLMSAPPGEAIERRLSRARAKLRKDAAIGKAFQAFLGYYNSNMRRISLAGGRRGKAELVRLANSFALACGLDTPPGLKPKVIGKMGLKGVEGLVVDRAGAKAAARSRPRATRR